MLSTGFMRRGVGECLILCFRMVICYLCIFGCPGSAWLSGLFSSCGGWGPFSGCGVQASHCNVFSCGAWALGHMGLNNCSYWALVHRLTKCGT